MSYGSQGAMVHITGVFEFDVEGRIVSYRDYFDFTEVQSLVDDERRLSS